MRIASGRGPKLAGFLGSLLCALVAGATTAVAFGGSPPSEPVQVCPKGKVWSSTAKKCVRVRSGEVPDSELIEQGRQLALAGHYEQAIAALEAVARRDDASVLTYLGFSYRKLGDIDRGMALYARALAIDPESVATRAYLGEGYLQKGDVEAAKAQLIEIARRCGTNCPEYAALGDAIALYLSGEPLPQTW